MRELVSRCPRGPRSGADVGREVLAGEGGAGGDEAGGRALEDDPAAVVPGAGAEVDVPVGVRAPIVSPSNSGTARLACSPTSGSGEGETRFSTGMEAASKGLPALSEPRPSATERRASG